MNVQFESAPILAIDPGSDKCGIAVVAADGTVFERSIVAPELVAETVRMLTETYAVQKIAIGDATTSRKLQQKLSAQFPSLKFTLIDERNSTLEARALYWKTHPPRGWRRVVPLSLQLPPVPIDDFAAVVLALRTVENDRNTDESTGN